MLPGFDPNQITNLDGARQAITLLLNLVEELKQENESLRSQVQQLRDEINRLKGSKGNQTSNPISQPKQSANILRKKSGGRASRIAKAARFTKSRSTGKKSSR
jgi:cell division septum initiation protein DivIVA